MTDRLPTPEELWGPDYREHLQRQFDIYDAAVARERAEIAARNAASSHVDGVPSTDLPQAPDLQGSNSHASHSTRQADGEKILDILRPANAVRNEIAARQSVKPPEDGVPYVDPQVSSSQMRNSNANGEKLVDNSTSPNAIRNAPKTQFSTADALKPPPPLEWCVEGLFACPSVSVLVGDPGSKKTFTIIDLAVCVAMGKPWLGHAIDVSSSSANESPLSTSGGEGLGVRGLPVLFIDEQTGPRQLLARFNAALNAHGAAAETPIHIHSLAGHSLRDKDSANELIKLARSKNARLIIIDAFSNLLRGGSESSLAAVLPALFHLRRLAEACKAAVVVTHHTNRHGSFRGSYAISAAADLMLQVESKSADPAIAFYTLKSRLLAPPSFSAYANFETSTDGSSRFFLSRQLGRVSSPQNLMHVPPGVSGDAFTVFDEIWHHEKMTFKELRNRRMGIPEGSLRNAVQQLLDEGVIARVDGGAQGTEATYALATPP